MKILGFEIKNIVDRIRGGLYGKMKNFEFEHTANETTQSEIHIQKKRDKLNTALVSCGTNWS